VLLSLDSHIYIRFLRQDGGESEKEDRGRRNDVFPM